MSLLNKLKNAFMSDLSEKLEFIDRQPSQKYIPNPQWMSLDTPHPRNKKEAQFLAPQLLKQMRESHKLIRTTTNPDIFFPRYDFTISRFDCLAACSKYVKFTGEQPAFSAKAMRRMDQRDAAVHDLIERCYTKTTDKMSKLKTDKGKQNAADKFRDSLLKYKDYMSDYAVSLTEERYQMLLSQI